MAKLWGYAGKILRVDLTNKTTSEEILDEATARKYLGGTGIGARYLYKEVLPGVKWSDEANRMIFASGPLGGTSLAGSGTISVTTLGPMTNGAAASQANGFFGAFLRFNGYDAIVLQGKANKWTYLYIQDGKVEFRDASQLVDKDTWQTTDLIKSQAGKGEHQTAVACIGPAGENLVKYACVVVDKTHIAAHGGMGAVMGSKKLKAIAVGRGKNVLELKDKPAFTAVADEIFNRVSNDPKDAHYKWGTLNTLYNRTKAGDGIVPVRNYMTDIYDIEPEKLEKYQGPYIRSHFDPKPNPCWACRMHHCHLMTLTEEPFKGESAEEPEYELLAAMGPVIGVTDVTASIYLANEIDRMGMDGNETGWTMGLAMECFQKGLLTTKDTDGLDLTWGNYESVLKMLSKIARREGFGDVLAEGAMRAAKRIGGEAPNFAIHTMKGNTPRGHDHRNRWPIQFDSCLAQVGTDEGYGIEEAEAIGLPVKVKGGYNTSAEDTLNWNIMTKGAEPFEDCLGVCNFLTKTQVKTLSDAVCAATGWDFTGMEGMKVGKRIISLLRIFNMEHGHTAEMDAPSPRYGSTPIDGPTKGRTMMPQWNEIRSKYYEGMGWDKQTGKPLPETIKNLGLDDIVRK